MAFNRAQIRRPSINPAVIGGPGYSHCSHCGRKMNDFAGGSSKLPGGINLCHPNAKNRPDCYRLVSIYKHPTPCDSQTCYENHEDFMIYVNAKTK